jgi:hypothetical protein
LLDEEALLRGLALVSFEELTEETLRRARLLAERAKLPEAVRALDETLARRFC